MTGYLPVARDEPCRVDLQTVWQGLVGRQGEGVAGPPTGGDDVIGVRRPCVAPGSDVVKTLRGKLTWGNVAVQVAWPVSSAHESQAGPD